MSEGKETNFFNKLKTDKKFRFEFIMAVWSGIVGIALVVGLVFVGKTFFFGKKVVDSGDLGDETPAVVTEQAIDAEETPAPYDSAIVSENEEDFQDDEEAVDDNLKDAKTAYATTVVNIRKEAALTADVIGKLQTGDEVKIIEYGKEWTKVEVNGIHFIAGQTINANSTADYQLIAGETINFQGITKNDLFIAGKNININENAKISRDLFVAGQNINISTNIKGNIFIAGDTININSKYIDGNIT